MGQPLRRAVFWDRDGTLMAEVDYCGSPAHVRAFPSAGNALRSLEQEGWINVIITNQSGIGRGYFSQSDYEAVNEELFHQLGVRTAGTYFCPETPEQATHRRKPFTGMVEEACRDLAIDPKKSWFVGDKTSDIACGKAAGCRTILVLTGYGAEHRTSAPNHVAADAAGAASIILSQPPH